MTLSVPSSIVADLATASSGTFDSLAPIIALLISVPIAFYVMRRVISLFPKQRSRS